MSGWGCARSTRMGSHGRSSSAAVLSSRFEGEGGGGGGGLYYRHDSVCGRGEDALGVVQRAGT